MARAKNSKAVELKNGTLTLNEAGQYSFETIGNGSVKIVLAGGQSTILSAAEFSSITTFNLSQAGTQLTVAGSFLDGKSLSFKGAGSLDVTGVVVPEAVIGSPVEANVNLAGISFGGTLKTVNGNRTDYFKTMWDLLDDAYVSGSYYNTPINEAFVRLGVEYVQFLEAGGQPLTDFSAKVSATRDQSMHDNLLGNLSSAVIQDRFSGTPALKAELLALIPDEYEARPSFDGNLSNYGLAAHDAVRAFDYDKGWNRPDYIDRAFGTVDALASDDRNNDGVDEQMFYGTGNSNTAFNIVRHEGAGVELALKAKEFGPNGGDYGLANVAFINGVAHYNVSSGASPDNANRADWSFDYAATVLPQGADDSFDFQLFIDIDETEGVNLVEVPMTTVRGLEQGSSNYGFGFIRGEIDIDDTTDGIQPYTYGPGEFDIVLEAYDDGVLIASNKIVVHVDGFGLA